ncbi:type I restriction enzyme HsdR N-terminal domain-containing protein [Flavobacterium microcysteis]|uniref:Type I restriction enzyme HsdR N-terminal domain-containing protein n=1 Tax=Flavobacterium microcysteis TaxID=2596891 RepID=A0A501QFU6_9FLAO|nr:type I restriction enzyme HsdR N-terminal domain-containing protein [Flavobacterium microcysteis]TPD71272.1 type I restriction enzyme HsdR N-terminal domain-containing protein [Flavobacterium microcysteis]
MEYTPLFNVLENFNFDLLNHPDFKEDSVREEIIVPIIQNLGYSASQPYQIIRSRNLTHPYVSIGSQRKKIYIIPDYIFEINGKPGWILDAKSPSESTINSIHVEQAYSYAIHSEVRVNYFVLCNGVYFTLYNISKNEPLLHFPIRAIPGYWSQIKEFLSPENIFKNSENIIKKDFGLHLKRLGFDQFEEMIFLQVPIFHIGQLDPNEFTMSAGVNIEDETYIATFDFEEKQFKQLKGKIPREMIDKLSVRANGSRQMVKFADRIYFVNINAKVGKKMEENHQEIFLPLRVNNFM